MTCFLFILWSFTTIASPGTKGLTASNHKDNSLWPNCSNVGFSFRHSLFALKSIPPKHVVRISHSICTPHPEFARVHCRKNKLIVYYLICKPITDHHSGSLSIADPHSAVQTSVNSSKALAVLQRP